MTAGKWLKSNSPYLIRGNIEIPVDSILIIEAGVKVEFQGDYHFSVEGILKAKGSKSDSVKFTSVNGKTWQGIKFNGESFKDTSILSFCLIENGHTDEGGGIYLHGDFKMILENSTVQNCYARMGGGICLKGDILQYAQIKNCVIRNNEAYLGGGGVIINSGNSKIIGCCIYDNRAEIRGAGLLTNGGNIYSPEIINCTVCNNINNDTLYRAVSIESEPKIINSIFYYNHPAEIAVVSKSYKPSFSYCAIEGDLKVTLNEKFVDFEGEFKNNLVNVIPGFIDYKNRDYRLGISHCIDKGKPDFNETNYTLDCAGNSRIYGKDQRRIDIGAFEYQDITPDRTPTITSGKELYLPDNTLSKIKIHFYDSDTADIHTVAARFANPDISVKISESADRFFILEINPLKRIFKNCWLYLTINDNTNTQNAILSDSILIHMSNQFKGEINSYIGFKDTVKIIGDIIVKKDGRLVASPGTILEFQGNYKIDVFGDTGFNGTPAEPIIMNARDTSYYFRISGAKTYRGKHGGGGITLHGTNNQNFEFMVIRNTLEGAFIVLDSKDITIKNCYFGNCHGVYEGNAGVYAERSNVTVKDCRFENGTSGEGRYGSGISARNASSVKVYRCKFGKNLNYTDLNRDASTVFSNESELEVKDCEFTDGDYYRIIEIIAGLNTVIENNYFQNNQAFYVIDATNVNSCLIRSNKFIRNYSRCIHGHLANLDVVNNLFAYNKYYCNCGDEIASVLEYEASGIGQQGRLINNTIVGNFTDASQGRTVFFDWSAGCAINNILWQNYPKEIGFANNYDLSGVSDPLIAYNIIRGGFKGENYNLDPNFEMSDSLDFRLKPGSLGIDRGMRDSLNLLPETDITGNQRINKQTNKVDIGAYEYYPVTGIKETKISERKCTVFPNPTTGVFRITTAVNNLINEIQVLTLGGTILKTIFPVSENLTIDISAFKAGMYLIKTKTGDRYQVQKLIKF